ncbi:hypothetical protein QBC98_005392 [Kitasatospora acidiphila]
MLEEDRMPEQPERPASGRRIDLSVAQVAASALAAVVGAVLASELGVYGTIIGAAVVSAGATCGGAVFQHLFRRTGEQLREVTERSPGSKVNGLRQILATDTAPLPLAWQDEPAEPEPLPDDSWNDSPVRRARRRWTWKGYAAVSALVFVLAMTPIVVVELASGQNLHAITTGQEGGGTSIIPDGGRKAPARAPRTEPAAPPTGQGASERPSGAPGGSSTAPSAPGTGSGSPSSSPFAPPSSASPSGGTTPSGAATPSATPSAPPTTRAPQPPATTPAGGATEAPATATATP